MIQKKRAELHRTSYNPTKRAKQYRDLLAERRMESEKRYNETKGDISRLLPMKEEYHRTAKKRNILGREKTVF